MGTHTTVLPGMTYLSVASMILAFGETSVRFNPTLLKGEIQQGVKTVDIDYERYLETPRHVHSIPGILCTLTVSP